MPRTRQQLEVRDASTYPLVEVEWEDASIDVDYDGPAEGIDPAPTVLQDVGYLLNRNKRMVTLAGSRSPDNSTVRWINKIPSRLVRRLTFFKEQPDGPQKSGSPQGGPRKLRARKKQARGRG